MVADAQSKLKVFNRALEDLGMELLGGFELNGDEGNFGDPGLGLMITNSGARMWPYFIASDEYKDDKSDPLDRWCKRVLATAAFEIEAKLISPNDRPFQPFQLWAKQAANLKQSPLGLLIHPKYGLWFGLRGALILPVNAENQALHKLIQQETTRKNICEKCIAKPCLSTCPVKAFSVDRLDVESCFSHIDSGGVPDCKRLGCVARAACPEGRGYAYGAEQLGFHMRSFRG